jgi:FtsZ-interacting cell division protein YlmF
LNNVVRRFANFLGLVDDEYGDFERPAAPSYDDEQITFSTRPVDQPLGAPRPGVATRPARPQHIPASGPQVIGQVPGRPGSPSIPRTAAASSFSEERDVVTYIPDNYNQSNRVVELLRQNRFVVIVNLGIDADLARRTVDFAAGATFALGGTIEKLGRYAFLVSPPHQKVPSDYLAHLKSQYQY